MKAPTEDKPIVCFLGPETSYTHQAVLQTFPPEDFELLPVVSIKGIQLPGNYQLPARPHCC